MAIDLVRNMIKEFLQSAFVYTPCKYILSQKENKIG